MRRNWVTLLGSLLVILLLISACGSPQSTQQMPIDSDGDGWSDAQEAKAGTDPNKKDSDDDGYWDPKDPNPLDSSIPITVSQVQESEATTAQGESTTVEEESATVEEEPTTAEEPTPAPAPTPTPEAKLAPSGVGSMNVYEERIGESGLLLEGPNLQMWVPQRYSEHGQVVFEYLQKGYPIISELLGGYKLPYKLSVEHYPRESEYWSGGTRGIGTIEYDYTNLEGNSPEWTKYEVPHVVGYYEEMAHNFIWQIGAPGFYETLGMMTGVETALRAAWNPHVQAHADWVYQVCADTHSYYREHNVGQPDLTPNIWLTRVLVHIFKSEVVDTYGWQALSQAFADMQREGLPLQKYNSDHKNGAFLNILSHVTATDMHNVFHANGMPLLTWTGENGYEKDGVERTTDNLYSFRVRIFDREGTQPANVRLFLYENGSTRSGQYPMSLVEGNAEAGWIYEKRVDIARPESHQYAFGAEDGLYFLLPQEWRQEHEAYSAVFQAVGKPTVKRLVE